MTLSTVPYGLASFDSLTFDATTGGDIADALTAELLLGGSWVDVTQWLDLQVGFSWGPRGRDHQFDSVNPCTFSATFYNDGRFTPGDPSRPAPFDLLTVNTRIRVTETLGGVSSVRFTGFVDSLLATWEGGVYPQVRISATDRFKMFARRSLKAMWEEVVLSDGPTAFYPLSEASGRRVTDLLGGSAGTLKVHNGGTYKLAKAGPFPSGETGLGLTATLVSPLVAGTPVTPYVQRGAFADIPAPLVADAPFTIEGWIRVLEPAATFIGALFAQLNPATGFSDTDLRVRCVGEPISGNLIFTASEGSYHATIFTPEPVTDRRWHHIAFGMKADKRTPFVFLDGVPGTPYAVASAAIGNFDNAKRTYFGGYTRKDPGNPALGVPGTADDYYFNGDLIGFTVYDYALSQAQVLVHVATREAFDGDRTDVRMGRFADIAGVATNLDVGYSNLLPQSTTGQSLLAAMQAVETSEQGELFMAGDDVLTLHSRYHGLGMTPITISAANGSVGVDFSVEEDEVNLVNSIDVTSAAGSVHKEDTASQGIHGVMSDSKDTLLPSVSDLEGFADRRLALFANPAPRTPVLTLDLLTDTSIAPVAFLIEPGTLIALTDLPVPDMTLVVESVAETRSVDVHSLRLTTSTAEDLSNVLVWDQGNWGSGKVWAA